MRLGGPSDRRRRTVRSKADQYGLEGRSTAPKGALPTPAPPPPEPHTVPDACPPPSVTAELARATAIARGSSCWLLDPQAPRAPGEVSCPPCLQPLPASCLLHWLHHNPPFPAARPPARAAARPPALSKPYPHTCSACLAVRQLLRRRQVWHHVVRRAASQSFPFREIMILPVILTRCMV